MPSGRRRWPLALLRARLGLRRAEIMAASGVGDATLRALESGELRGLTVRDLVAVGHALGVPPASLVPGLESPPARPGLVQAVEAEAGGYGR